MLRLRPLLVTRFANAFGGLVIPFIPFMVLLQVWNPDDFTASAIAIPLGLVSLLLAVRGFRLGVVCGPVVLTVRGYWRSRTIPIADVLDLHEVLLLFAILKGPAHLFSDMEGRRGSHRSRFRPRDRHALTESG